MARLSKMTDGRLSVLLMALRAGNTRRASIAHAGIAIDTFYRWLAQNRTFSDAIKKAEADAEVRHVAIVAQAGQRSWQASAWCLERRRHEDYGQRRQVDFRFDVESEVRRMAAEEGLDVEAALAEMKTVLKRVGEQRRN
jgi:hypothetical protein